MSTLRNKALCLAAAVGAFPLYASPALADAPPADGTGSTAGIDEIVVTAQRREQGVLSVPLSITAISGSKLNDAGLKKITDLQFATPGLNVSDGSGYTQVFIRGVGNVILVGADPSVATFIDDVPRIYGSMVNNFVDVERVEVLKGAQGGLYGRNATGGVINIVTRQPRTDETSANFRLSYGERNTIEAAGYVNIPIVTDRIALSLAGERRVHDAYLPNLASPAPYSAQMFPAGSFLGTPQQTAAFFNSGVNVRDFGNQNFWSTDGKLLIKVSDNLKVTLAADYSHKNDSDGISNHNITPSWVQNVSMPLFFTSIFGIQTNFPPGFVTATSKKFTVDSGYYGNVSLTDYGYSATAVLGLPGFDVTSITAYRNQHTIFLDDLANASVPVFLADVNNHKHYFYQEVRAVSNSSGPVQWVAGATYLKSHYDGVTTGIYLPPLAPDVPISRAIDKVTNWSVYLQGTYDITDKLSLTGSGRFIHETNSALFPDVGDTLGQSEKKFLPSATLSYKLAGGGNAYLRWARGFKAGGINPVAPPSVFTDVNEGSAFKGEEIDTYEAGHPHCLVRQQGPADRRGVLQRLQEAAGHRLQQQSSDHPGHRQRRFGAYLRGRGNCGLADRAAADARGCGGIPEREVQELRAAEQPRLRAVRRQWLANDQLAQVPDFVHRQP